MSAVAAPAPPPTTDAQELAELARLIEAVRRIRPWWTYLAGRPDWPEDRRFQLQFHKSTHINRVMALGNGAGKTTVMATEVNWWLTHTHPYQDTPAEPVQVIWVCLAYKQLELLKRNIEERLSAGWVWQEQKHRYLFPDGSTLTVVSADGDWAGIQGIEPDLVVIDEECQRKWWGEFQMRRRVRPTRYIIGATATQGKRWIYSELYLPWLLHHKELGLDEDQAMVAQRHPVTWMWAKGGLEDNPAATPEAIRHYRFGITYASDAERQVRNHGGFADFNTAPVFNQKALDEIDTWRAASGGGAGAQGLLVFNPNKTPPDGIPVYEWLPNGAEYHGGYIRIFQLPEPGRTYVLGADFAQGLAGGDSDAAIVCGVGEDDNLYQVAEAVGQWGGQRFSYVLAALGWFYNYALLVGERNAMGLDVLRRLHDELGYVYQYMADDDPQKYRRKSDRLGYAKFHGSLVIPRLQWAVAPVDVKKAGERLPPRVYVRGTETLDQLRRYQFKPISVKADLGSTPDRKLTTGGEAGTKDDLVSALAGCVTGWIELPKFQREQKQYAPGTAGDVLRHADLTAPPQRRRSAFTVRKKD